MDDSQLSVVEKEALGECFASAEARFEYEKARRLRWAAMLVGGVVALIGFGFFMYWLGGVGRAPAGAGKGAADSHGDPGQKKLDAKPVGSPDAKVQVIAILPAGSDCHNGVAKFLGDAATKNPEKIRVEYTTMAEYGEKKLENQVGSVCAAVLINGKSAFEVTCEGKPRKITLVGTEPTHYSMADVGEALTSVFVAQYGDPDEPLFEPQPGAKCGHAGDEGKSCSGPSGPGGAPGTPAATDTEPLELPGFREMKPKP
jgi:hypothetical protein